MKKLFVSSQRQDSNSKTDLMTGLELQIIRQILNSGGDGYSLCDLREYNSTIISEFPQKTFITDDIFDFTDLSTRYKNIYFLLYGKTLHEFQKIYNWVNPELQTKIIPSIPSLEFANFISTLNNIPNFKYIDIAPIGNNTRHDICGNPIGIKMAQQLTQQLESKISKSTKFIFTGGIRLKKTNSGIYTPAEIKQLTTPEKFGGITVGSPISGATSEQIPEIVKQYKQSLGDLFNINPRNFANKISQH